jgi:hypothetical protein
MRPSELRQEITCSFWAFQWPQKSPTARRVPSTTKRIEAIYGRCQIAPKDGRLQVGIGTVSCCSSVYRLQLNRSRSDQTWNVSKLCLSAREGLVSLIVKKGKGLGEIRVKNAWHGLDKSQSCNSHLSPLLSVVKKTIFSPTPPFYVPRPLT